MTIGSLARHSGTWGVGDAGLGPRIEREEPWADWVPVEPEAATDTPSTSCSGRGRASVPASRGCSTSRCSSPMTSSPDLPVDRRLEAWWTDGGRAASLDGSVHQITPVGERGISYLVRERQCAVAGRPLRVPRRRAAAARYALTICIPAEG